MIFDGFTFYDELDLLEIRLRELYDAVDWFVLCESPFDFMGNPKPLHFIENIKRFAPWVDKIRHVEASRMPNTGDPVDNERHQRNAIAWGWPDAAPDDLVLVSDVDEIPRASVIPLIPRDSFVHHLKLLHYHYSFNWVHRSIWTNVFDVRATLRSSLIDCCTLRGCPSDTTIPDAGWHLSWFGGDKQIAQKVPWYPHELPGLSLRRAGAPIALLDGAPLEWIDDIASLPRCVREIPAKWSHLFAPAKKRKRRF